MSAASDGPDGPERPELSIVILSWNTRELTRKCLETVVGPDHGLRLEVVVVDNASHDGSAAMVAAGFPGVRLLQNAKNEGYARGNNQGIAVATAPLVLLLNSDTEVRHGALRLLVEFLRTSPDHGAVAPRLVNPDGTVQRSCMRFPDLTVGFLHDSWFERRWGRSKAVRRYFMEDFDHLHDADVDQPPGACILLRRGLVQEIGGFDESLFLFFNDVELCRSIRDRGWKIRYLAGPEVLHHVGKSTSQFKDFVVEWNVNRIRYYRKRHGLAGALTVKAAVLLRAFEEWRRVRRTATGDTRAAAVGEIRRVVRTVLKA